MEKRVKRIEIIFQKKQENLVDQK
jgi:hypothetical protein